MRSTVIARCVMAPGGSPKRGNVDPAQRKGGKRSAREGQIKPSTPRLLLLSFLLSLIPHEIGLIILYKTTYPSAQDASDTADMRVTVKATRAQAELI